MRVIDFLEDEAVGPRSRKRQADLATVLTGGPYPCIGSGEIPPLAVVNDLANSGTGGGMHGGWRWEPLTVSEEEYEELVEALLARGGFELVDVPAWVTTRSEWSAWLMERRHGVDAAENLRLRRVASEATTTYDQARDSGDRQLAADAYVASVRANIEADNFACPSRLLADGGTFRDASDALMDATALRAAARMRGNEDAARALEPDIEQLKRRVHDLGG